MRIRLYDELQGRPDTSLEQCFHVLDANKSTGDTARFLFAVDDILKYIPLRIYQMRAIRDVVGFDSIVFSCLESIGEGYCHIQNLRSIAAEIKNRYQCGRIDKETHNLIIWIIIQNVEHPYDAQSTLYATSKYKINPDNMDFEVESDIALFEKMVPELFFVSRNFDFGKYYGNPAARIKFIDLFTSSKKIRSVFAKAMSGDKKPFIDDTSDSDGCDIKTIQHHAVSTIDRLHEMHNYTCLGNKSMSLDELVKIFPEYLDTLDNLINFCEYCHFHLLKKKGIFYKIFGSKSTQKYLEFNIDFMKYQRKTLAKKLA